ncbi:MAG TPA: pitrilysin family protein [Vicinamibacterales bacterium]|jgi:predicted Zn-dependent peptidase
MNRLIRGGLSAAVIAGLALTVTLGAATAPRVQFTDAKLENGLRVIIAEDHTAPTFSIAVTYNVGSRNERPGRTGFAHLFEHMMFKGSENVGSGEHFVLVYGNGGDMNGSTNKDRTNYFERLPANQLDLALFLEADRMKSLDITKDNLQNQISTVQEERRQSVDNQPYGRTMEALDGLMYENASYRHSVIGSMQDLTAATVDDVSAFFRTYYAPNNAVLAIVGDVKPVECLAKVRKYFEGIPSQPPPPEPDMTEPAQTREKRLTIDDPLVRMPRIDIAYHIPPANTADSEALNVLGTVLSSGRSSRFFENVVRQKQLATQAFAGALESRGPGQFRAIALVAPGKDVADVEAAVYAEIDRVKTGTIEDWELQKARNSARRSLLGGLTSSLQRAVMLSQYAVYYNDPNIINTKLGKISAVTAADVQRVAGKYLTPENRTVVITMPKPAAATKGGE